MNTWTLCPDQDPTPRALGGRLCLAIVNSVLWRRSAEPIDVITDFTALIGYLARIGLVDDEQRTALSTAASARPSRARQVHAETVRLREALYSVMSAAAARRPPPALDLFPLTGTLRDGMAHLDLVAAPDGGVEPGWARDPDDLAWPLWEIAASATAVLGHEAARLKQCPGPTCGWVFIDASRNQSRRWCDSTMCGNRARARRHYRRHRAAGSRKDVQP